MENDTFHSPVAITYAQAMLELAIDDEKNNPASPELVGQELVDLRKILEVEPMVGALFTDPSIGQENRSQMLDRVFANRVSPLVLRFLQVLNEKGRLNLLPFITGAYQVLLDKRQGKVEVDVTVAQRLSPEALDAVRQRISNALKREAIVHQYVDPSIIGGLILRVQDRLIDGSVRSQLEAMRNQLREAQPG
jgi:F-type H+-transporting ATPase subunit delta